MLSVGFDAAVVHQVVAWRANGQTLRRVNRLSYAKPIADVLRSYRYGSVQLEADGRCVSGTHAFVFNLPQYGFQFPFAPHARGDDGWFDWIVFGQPGFRAMLDYAWSVMRTKHLSRTDVQHGRARQIRISAPEAMPVQVDGEAAGFTPIDAEIVPAALCVLMVS
jgi:diacylglycerol kinase family enzyme